MEASLTVERFLGGCYDASRAAALSGVPKSTVYDWARKGVVTPSVSPVREMLWSYADLVALRIISWLRHEKPAADGGIPSSPMPQVRAALHALASSGVDLWASGAGSPLVVEATGKVLVRIRGELQDPITGATALPDPLHSFGLTGPFDLDGLRGPNLLRPRPHLRIVPGKVSGEPHVEGTRITTPALASLIVEGYDTAAVASMYDISEDTVDEAASLEVQLGTFAAAAA